MSPAMPGRRAIFWFFIVADFVTKGLTTFSMLAAVIISNFLNHFLERRQLVQIIKL